MQLFGRPKVAILLVCTANICRSPMAEGVLRHELGQRRHMHGRYTLDSAGTNASQPGHAPDRRAQVVCEERGIDIGRIRARQIRPQDFEKFQHILAVDTRNYARLLETCPELYRHKISRVTAWSDGTIPVDIPDPYFGNKEGFTKVFDLLQAALARFVAAELD